MAFLYIHTYILTFPICLVIFSVNVNERDAFNPIYLRDTFKTMAVNLVRINLVSDEGVTIMSNLTYSPITRGSHATFRFVV